MEQPLISVIMPIFNREEFLAEAIESIIAQDHINWELILINDGSTDSSETIAEKYSEGAHRIRTVNHKVNQGIHQCRNLGISLAGGELIAFLDSDDWAHPQRLSTQLRLIQQGFDMVGSALQFMDEQGRIIGEHFPPMNEAGFREKMPYTLPLPNPTLLAKKNVFEKVGPYRFTCAEDYDFFLRAYDLGIKITNSPQPLIRMRMHLNNTGVLHVRKQRYLSRLAWQLHLERQKCTMEKTDWQTALSQFRERESLLEQKAAFFYRKAYVLQSRHKIACAINLCAACLLWPPNIHHLLRKIL